TCHNRKEKTLQCLKSLYSQKFTNKTNVDIKVYMCDDGSTDGTSDAVKEFDSKINIVHGDGNLYWARGMEKALSKAREEFHDFFLMINDDVVFYNNMLETMLNSYFNNKSQLYEIAIVGSTQDDDTMQWSYGGRGWEKKAFRSYMPKVKPSKQYKTCTFANWNCFLIPPNLLDIVGNIDSFYEHGLADYDYSYRIIKSKNKIYVADKYVGTCKRNGIHGTWRDSKLSIWKRLKCMQARNAHPIKSEIHFYKLIYNYTWPFWLIKSYLNIIKKIIITNFIKSSFNGG
ncbi:MAG: glycosyltransferase family 2 protein, partial [bacterium]